MLVEIEGAGKFHTITKASTIERDIVIANLLRASGAQAAFLEKVTAGLEPDTAVFEAFAASGMVFDFLGAALMPVADEAAPRPHWLQRLTAWVLQRPGAAARGHGGDPLNWTPAIGAATAERLKHVTAPAGKQMLTHLVVAAATSFFMAGLHSLVTSRSSLRAMMEGGTAVRPKTTGGNGSAAPMSSESGR
jgi:hypothetical protein